MAITVTETAAQYVSHVFESVLDNEAQASVSLGKVTVRLPEETIALLDYVGGKLRMSRSALAAELLCRVVEEAVAVVGLPSEEDGFQLTLNEEAYRLEQDRLDIGDAYDALESEKVVA